MPRTSDEEQELARQEMLARESGVRSEQPEAPKLTMVQAARAAHTRGDRFFEVQLGLVTVDGTAVLGSVQTAATRYPREPDVLGRIEDEGWRLENVDYVFVPTGAESSNRALLTGQRTATSGYVAGIYLFRRTPSRP